MARDRIRAARTGAALGAALALATSACASEAAPTSTSASSAEPTTFASPTMAASATAAALPGEPIEFGPREGDILAVAGVDHDDALPVHATPGNDADVLVKLGPLAEDVVALGGARALDNTIWYQVSVDGGPGWVDSTFVQHRGSVDDITSSVVSDLGSTPQAATMTGLGFVVAGDLASTDPPSRITIAAPASLGRVGRVTYDVVGIGDDSIGGYRLRIVGTPEESGFVLKTVERTLWCARGVEGGVCV